MPASVSPNLRGVTRNESTRSDSSNTSQSSSAAGNKKVSFNQAVRVKKFQRPKKGDSAAPETNGDVPDSPGKRFWFRVYKNKHRSSPNPVRKVIYYGNDPDDLISYHPNPPTSECGTQTVVRTFSGQEHTPLHPSQMPPEPPAVRRHYVKKIVNRFNEEAVLQRQSESPPSSPPGSPRFHSTPNSTPKNIPPPPPPPPPPPEGLFSSARLKRNPIVNGVKVMFGMSGKKSSHKTELTDSYEDNAHHSDDNFQTTERRWRTHKIELESPLRRKAMSHGDLTADSKLDKGVSTEELSFSTREKGIQCSKIPNEPHRYKVIRPRNGVVSAYSHVPSLDDKSDLYSQIDKSKKTKKKQSEGLFKSRSEPLYIGPPPPKYEEEKAERRVKTSKRSFGFKLMRAADEEEDWYNVDGDLEAVTRRDVIGEVRQELADESEASSLSNGERRSGGQSVMREVDYKRREISYENIPRSDGERISVQPGLWYRDADEDYRREMAQSEVSYPAGHSVGSDRFLTVDRRDKKPPPSPRAYTLDRKHLKSVPKILINGKEVHKARQRKIREDPSSVQSDPLYVRGGLAAAYQARQRAAVRRSNSTVERGLIASSEVSSESDSARHHRKPLVMYIPGISHAEKSSDVSVSRSHSMMQPTRPPRINKRSGHKSHSKTDIYRNGDLYEEDEIMPLASDRKKPPKVPNEYRKHNDVKRRHSMPKDTKFAWLKWKIRGKPSREP